MITPTASRFAVLSVDDDDDEKPKKNPKKKPDAGKAPPKTNEKKKPSKTPSQPEGGKNKSDKKNKKKSPGSKKNAVDEQWDAWLKKDAELVDESYEQQLYQAILMSKLDYEEKKANDKDVSKKDETANKKQGKKSKKTTTMSLEEFNNLDERGKKEPAPPPTPIKEESNFFEKVSAGAQTELQKAKAKEAREARNQSSNKQPPLATTAEKTAQQSAKETKMSLKACQEALDLKIAENAKLQEKIGELENSLLAAKSRCKKLCRLLADGEAREKAELLVEAERLRKTRDELTSEVNSLYQDLEKERSKIRALEGKPTKASNSNKH